MHTTTLINMYDDTRRLNLDVLVLFSAAAPQDSAGDSSLSQLDRPHGNSFSSPFRWPNRAFLACAARHALASSLIQNKTPQSKQTYRWIVFAGVRNRDWIGNEVRYVACRAYGDKAKNNDRRTLWTGMPGKNSIRMYLYEYSASSSPLLLVPVHFPVNSFAGAAPSGGTNSNLNTSSSSFLKSSP